MQFAALVFCTLHSSALVAAVYGASCSIDSENKCRCSESTTAHLDLSCYFQYPYEFDGRTGETTYTYRFSPCSDTVCGVQNGTMCQYAADLDRWFVLGRPSDPKWTIHSSDPLNFTVEYGDGELGPNMQIPRRTLVTFVHTESAMDIQFIKEDPQLVYDFHVSGSDIESVKQYTSCKTGKSQHTTVGIVGLVLISLAILGLVGYCVIGSIVNYKVKGARRSEVIPNVSFWKELPFLIKDGVLFTLSPFISRLKRTSSSRYDKM